MQHPDTVIEQQYSPGPPLRLPRCFIMSSGHEARQFDCPRVEGRGGPAAQLALLSPDQTIGKPGGAVLPEV
jgi:hypothetical protein